MASSSAADAHSLVQNLFDDGTDANITFEEAVLHTEALKLNTLTKPIIFKKEAGVLSIGALPLRDMPEGGTGGALKHVVDIIIKCPKPDYKQVERAMLVNAYTELPPPFSLATDYDDPYTMEFIVAENEGGETVTIVKHILYTKRVKLAMVRSHLRGVGHVIDYNKNFRTSAKAFAYMMDNVGQWQVRYLLSAATGPAKSKSETQVNEGFDFIEQHAPRQNSRNQMTRWVEIQINSPESPLHGWSAGLVEKCARNLASSKDLALVTHKYPLTLKAIRGYWLDNVFYKVLKTSDTNSLLLLGEAGMGKSRWR